MANPYGGAPGYGAPQMGGAPPGGAGYGAPPAGGYRPPAPQGGYGAPPGGYGGPPGGQAPPPGGFGAPGGYGAPPGIDPQVLQWFQAVDQDRSGKITAHELQQALTNANWSHFNPETCRLMIGMFDKDHSGTIDINEFSALWGYIHQWRGIFDQFDRDKSGQIDSTELCSAFNTIGYRLSPQFCQLVVCRFDIHARRFLTLDNFIQACVLLKSVTDTFRQKDAQQAGNIRIGYEEFMCMCMLNKP